MRNLREGVSNQFRNIVIFRANKSMILFKANRNFKLNLWVVFLVLYSLESCNPKEIEPLIASPVPPSLDIFLLNGEDSSNIFNSANDSITLVFPYPNSEKPTFGKLVDWGETHPDPNLQCGMLITYSAIDNIKTSYLYYENNPIPDTLFVDYKTEPNPEGWKDYNYIPIRITLNSVPAQFGKNTNVWVVYK